MCSRFHPSRHIAWITWSVFDKFDKISIDSGPAVDGIAVGFKDKVQIMHAVRRLDPGSKLFITTGSDRNLTDLFSLRRPQADLQLPAVFFRRLDFKRYVSYPGQVGLSERALVKPVTGCQGPYPGSALCELYAYRFFL